MSTLGVPPMRSSVLNEKPLSLPPSRARVIAPTPPPAWTATRPRTGWGPRRRCRPSRPTRRRSSAVQSLVSTSIAIRVAAPGNVGRTVPLVQWIRGETATRLRSGTAFSLVRALTAWSTVSIRTVAGDGHTLHHAHRGPVVGHRVVLGRAVVPERERVGPPPEPALVLGDARPGGTALAAARRSRRRPCP